MKMTKVLLVDDEVGFVETMTKRLTRRNLLVLKAFSGLEALNLVKKEPDLDVVILDVKMPEMDGIETLREIKRTHPLVEVIMLTGHATVESAIKGMQLGAFDYLMKPTDMDQLLAKLEEASRKKRTHEGKIAEARARAITLRRGD